jgi:hypothetical protein
VFLVEGRRNRDDTAKKTVQNLPDAAVFVADTHKERTVVSEGQRMDALSVLVLEVHVVKELILVELNNVENFLC